MDASDRRYRLSWTGRDVPDWHNIGYPAVDCRADGSFLVCQAPKHRWAGQCLFSTVGEQVLYEIGDPAAYLPPDVMRLHPGSARQAGPDVVG